MKIENSHIPGQSLNVSATGRDSWVWPWGGKAEGMELCRWPVSEIAEPPCTTSHVLLGNQVGLLRASLGPFQSSLTGFQG